MRGGADLEVAPPLERQSWAARRIDFGGARRDMVLDWAGLRSRLSRSDARLLLRTSASDLAVRDDVVVFEVAHCRGYCDGDALTLLTETPAAAAAAARVEAALAEALAAGPAAAFAATALECVLEEAYRDASDGRRGKRRPNSARAEYFQSALARSKRGLFGACFS